MKILLLKGGPSSEHDVSIKTASYVSSVLRELGHDVDELLLGRDGLKELFAKDISGYDVVFPALHGYAGEDGKVQAYLEMKGKACASEGATVSAIGMDKRVQRMVASSAGVNSVPFLSVRSDEAVTQGRFEEITKEFGSSLILKPQSGGSSIGVICVENAILGSVNAAISEIAKLDERALVEKFHKDKREIEVGVLYSERERKLYEFGPVEVTGDGDGVIDYKTKYSSAKVEMAALEPLMKESVLNAASDVFGALGGTMYMRVDFFLIGEELLFNEVNTIPGMTKTSHYPYMANRSIGMKKVISTLLDNAILRNERQKARIRNG